MPARPSSRGTPLRFVIVGLINTFTGLTVIYFCKWALGVADLPANLLGYLVGFGVSFVLNGRWTFGFRGHLSSTLMRYMATTVVGYCVNLAIVTSALHLTRMNSYLAQASGVIPYALVVYFGSKHYVFTQRGITPANAGGLQ